MREDTTRLDEVLATDSKTPPKTATYTADAANASRDLPRTFELTFDNQQRPRSRRPISIVGKLRITPAGPRLASAAKQRRSSAVDAKFS